MHGIQFHLNEEVGSVSDVVYAFMVDKNVLYFGETSVGLNARFQGYRYGTPLETDTDNRIKKEITLLLESGVEVSIWFAIPVGYIELPNGEKLEIPASKPLEEFLISKYKPELNVKNLRK